MIRYSILALVLSLTCWVNTSAQRLVELPEGIQPVPHVYDTEPWEDPQITELNRDAARATAYSFKTEAEALIGKR